MTATTDLPTEEELLRVRRFECSMFRHDFEVLVGDDGAPRAVTCKHCTQRWPCLASRLTRRRSTERPIV